MKYEEFETLVEGYYHQTVSDYEAKKAAEEKRISYLNEASEIYENIGIYEGANKLLNAVSDKTLGAMLDTVTSAVMCLAKCSVTPVIPMRFDWSRVCMPVALLT